MCGSKTVFLVRCDHLNNQKIFSNLQESNLFLSVSIPCRIWTEQESVKWVNLNLAVTKTFHHREAPVPESLF